MRALLLIIALVVAGCRSQQAPPAAASSPQAAELEVLVSFLSDYYKSSVQSNTSLVITDTFSIAMLRMGHESHEKLTRSLLSHASDEIPTDLIRDFCAKNAKPQAVWPTLGERLSVVLLSRQELERLFAAGPGDKPDGWDRFYAKYPKSPGIITISRVGFNRRGDMAMVYVGSQSHWLAGSGHIRILRKQGDKWVVVPAIIGPMWVS
jgi:hypothetical protein